MISELFLSDLVCPETHQPLELVEQGKVDKINQLIREKKLITRGNLKVVEEITGALLRQDKTYAYPIRRNIPVMIVEESFKIEF